VIQHPLAGQTPLGLSIVLADQLSGVGTQQIMKAKPARHLLGNQVTTGQLRQRLPRLNNAQTGQARHRSSGHVRPGMQPQRPQHSTKHQTPRPPTTSSRSYDQENTARTSTLTSPPSNARNPPRA